MASPKGVLHGQRAVHHVEQELGRTLTSGERRVVMEEGYVPYEYDDATGKPWGTGKGQSNNGIKTYGVGQTGKWIQAGFPAAYKEHEDRVRDKIPSYDQLPTYLQDEFVQSTYRGDLSGSPTARKLFNAGDFSGAATEFLNNDDYRNTTSDGIRNRIRSVAHGMRKYGAEQQLQTSQDAASRDGEFFKPRATLSDHIREANQPPTDQKMVRFKGPNFGDTLGPMREMMPHTADMQQKAASNHRFLQDQTEGYLQDITPKVDPNDPFLLVDMFYNNSPHAARDSEPVKVQDPNTGMIYLVPGEERGETGIKLDTNEDRWAEWGTDITRSGLKGVAPHEKHLLDAYKKGAEAPNTY